MTIIQDMLEKYDCRNATDYRNALKEIIQEVALCGMSHSGFFKSVLSMEVRHCVFSMACNVFRRIWTFPYCRPTRNLIWKITFPA